MSNHTRQTGFTLIEILIALAIFAILATLTSSILYYTFNTRHRVNEQADILMNLQLAITLISRDTEQIVNRALRQAQGQLIPAFIGNGHYIEFTRGGIIDTTIPFNQSSLKRIAFMCQQNQLIRRTWNTLDAVNRNQFSDKLLLANLKNCEFVFLNKNLDVLTEWRENAVQQNQEKESFPKAIKLSFSLNKWGYFNQLFILPQALYASTS